MKEIRWVATVEVGKLQGQVDGLAKQIRELNAAIQEAGWALKAAFGEEVATAAGR